VLVGEMMHKGPTLSLESFDYSLPESLIAQQPTARRAGSRLLHMERETGAVEHRDFEDIVGFIRPGDLLVINDTKVFPARIPARRVSGGSVELMLTQYPGPEGSATCLVRPGRRMRDGETVLLGNEGNDTLLLSCNEDQFTIAGGSLSVEEAISRYGQVPLPPYIKRDLSGPDDRDRTRYQTVYANQLGAVAAPTAGLHVDTSTLQAIRSTGAGIARVTLHVGPGTFQPVRVQDISRHTMGVEVYSIPYETMEAITEVGVLGGRVIAVGTTVVRALESAWMGSNLEDGDLGLTGSTDLFITPGYRFTVVDALLTNFHLPRSTLLMLVCAFAGTDFVMKAYREAVENGYRFYSYGDAMFIE
jgi:S-adenosylmethionine:tRNA ribosyltransferase-isomerase